VKTDDPDSIIDLDVHRQRSGSPWTDRGLETVQDFNA